METREDLARAIQAGARYVQGYMFARAEPEFREPACFASLIEAELDQHLLHFVGTERYWQRQSEKLAEQWVALVQETRYLDHEDDWIEGCFPSFTTIAFGFICAMRAVFSSHPTIIAMRTRLGGERSNTAVPTGVGVPILFLISSSSMSIDVQSFRAPILISILTHGLEPYLF